MNAVVKKQPVMRLARSSASDHQSILTTGRQTRDILNDTLRALAACNDPPRIFLRDGDAVQIIDTENGPSIRDLDANGLRALMCEAADWYGGRNHDTAVSPPADIAKMLLSTDVNRICRAHDIPELPILKGIVTAPFLRADWTICGEPGYDARSRVWLNFEGNIAIPAAPTQVDAQQALKVLLDPFREFVFATESGLANALALLLTPIIRPAVDVVPLAAIDASTPGSGKSLLANVVSIVASGEPGGESAPPESEAEMRKYIDAALRAGRTIIKIDNLDAPLHSPSLASRLTSVIADSRVLGVTEELKLPNVATWIVTGNNVRLRGVDMPRRTYFIRIDPCGERPQERGFERPDTLLLDWVREHLSEILAAALTMIQAWIVADRPEPAKLVPVGTFTQWQRLVGGVLSFAGADGFLGDWRPTQDAADEPRQAWKAMLERIAAMMPEGAPFTISELVGHGDEDLTEVIRQALEVSGDPDVLPRKLGYIFRDAKDKVVSGLKLVGCKPTRNGVARWAVVPSERR